MARVNSSLLAFNRGEVGRRALARIDMDRLKLSAETQLNWVPRAAGSMSLRPGTEYLTETYGNSKAKTLTFFRSMTQIHALEFTDLILRPLIDDAPIIRTAVSTTITNGDFAGGGSWTVTNYGAATSSITGGQLVFACVPVASYSTCTQTVAIAGGDQNVEHALRLIVSLGVIKLRVGTAAGLDDLIGLAVLKYGEHSLSFTPTGANIYISLESAAVRNSTVDSILIEAAGEVTLPSPYEESYLDLIRYAHSGDVMYLDCLNYTPRRIERRNNTSWSIVTLPPEDGPFTGINTTDTKLSISAPRGSAVLTASKSLFVADDVGQILRIFTPGYNFPYSIALADAFTPAVRANGISAGRRVYITITGTWVGTLTLQKSYTDEYTGFTDHTTYVGNTVTNDTDGIDGAIVWWRIGFKPAAYTSGTAVCTLTFGDGGAASGMGRGETADASGSVGGRNGICRVTAFTSATSVNVEILTDFSSSIASEFWYKGAWNSLESWPSAVAFHEGRLCHGSRNALTGSVPDNYTSFSLDVTGESAPIQRSIGYGPITIINGLISMTRLTMLTEGSEVQAISSSLEEPLISTNFSLKDVSTYGGARIAPLKVDQRGFFVDNSGQRLMEISYTAESQRYRTRDLHILHPDINLNNPVVHIAVQRRPDTRIHCVREDGTVAILLYEPDSEVAAWFRYETDGIVEDVYVKPEGIEDGVYYVVARTINGVAKRFHEKWAREDQCQGADISRQADCFYHYSGASAATITGLDHLEAETVVAWGNGKALGEYTVASGQITLSEAVAECIVGLGYTAQFKSSRLAYGAAGGTALLQKKRVHSLGVVLYNTHYQGLKYGPDFDNLSDLPLIERGEETAVDTIWADYDEPAFEFEGEWNTDSRLCLQAEAPYPATVLACVIGMETHEK